MQPLPAPPAGVPQTWYEQWASIWDPYMYILAPQRYGCTIAAAAAQDGNTGNIQVPEDIYVFAFESRATIAGGGFPSANYRIGFRSAAGDNWTNGQWFSALVTGDTGNAFMRPPRDFNWPREVRQNEIIVVTVDNSLNAAITTVDANIFGFVVRMRDRALQPLTQLPQGR